MNLLTRTPSRFIPSSLLIFALTLCGCGGGGGSKSPDTTPTNTVSSLSSATITSSNSSSAIASSSSLNAVISSTATSTFSSNANSAATSSAPSKLRIAQINYLPNPKNLTDMVATTTGLYGIEVTPESEKPDTVYKWQSFEGSTGWLERKLPTHGSTFAPQMLRNDQGLDIFWRGYTIEENDGIALYEYLRTEEKESIGIDKFIPMGFYSGQPLHWAVADGKVYKKKSGGSFDSRESKDTYQFVATLPKVGRVSPAVAEEYQNVLYIGGGSTLYRVASEKNVKKFELPADIHTLISALGYIWIGSGDSIWKLKEGDDTPEFFAHLTPNTFIFNVGIPLFCISYLDLYTADGIVYKGIEYGPTPTPKSFLLEGDKYDLPLKDQLIYDAISIGLRAPGIYCADTVNRYIYTQAFDPADFEDIEDANDPRLSLIKPKTVQIIPL